MTNLKIALFQFNPTVGALSDNTDKLISAITTAKANGAHLFISSELCICGYPPEDLLLRDAFYTAVLNELKRLIAIHGITMLIGCPYREQEINYNSIFILRDGHIIGRYDKQFLPNTGVFDEVRYFKPGNTSMVFECEHSQVGVIICEDTWHSEPALASRAHGAQLLCVLNASPFIRGKQAKRLIMAKQRVSETKIPMIYLNQTGGQDELIFDGASFAVNADGSLVMQLPAYEEKLAYLDYNAGVLHCLEEISEYPADIESVYQALVLGVRDYINKNAFKGVLLGLSGGIDSALTMAIAVDALGADRVMAVMMPSMYTADISITDSRDMVKRLGVRYEEIVISQIFEQFKLHLKPVFNGQNEDATEENLQARTRGTLLMAISNKLGYLVLTTGNKSEMTTGYATLYGDMAGGFAVLKDVLKTDVYNLCNYRNTISGIIPQRIITRPPSAELRDNQTDQDSLPDYALLDKIIILLVEKGKSSQDIIELGFDKKSVEQVARLLKINEYKRRQAAVGPKISSFAYAKDWRYPITSGYKF